MTGVARLLTFVDLTDHDDGPDARRRLVLLDDRGWSGKLSGGPEPVPSIWEFETVEGIEREARDVVGPDEPRQLPHDVELSTRLRVRVSGMFERAAPGFLVRDAYGFATRDGVEIHLGQVAEADHHRAAAYVFVLDADAIAAEWRAAGAEVHGPDDTPSGKHEGAMVDPDGNAIRFGSPIA